MASYYTHVHNTYHPDISPTDFLPPHGGETSMLSHLGMSNDDGDSDSVQNGFNLMLYPDTSTTDSPPSLVSSSERPGSSSPHFLLPDTPDVVHSESHQTRKLRKDKLRIELSPDQPPTTQGRPRARVFVACVQWCAPSPRRHLAVPISFR
jgi:hypothetical protein